MSNKFNDPWSSRERIELLVNILQGQPQDLVSYLTHVIHENRITPRWPETALPNGMFCPPGPRGVAGTVISGYAIIANKYRTLA